jgi:ribosomal protein S12 methylthiotransferase
VPTPPRKVGFVSLGCPKATVDSEHILTRLRAEGYLVAPSYQDSDLVVVNTCGFIDAAVEESLDAIGEALAENGKVIVTGCLGAKGDIVQSPPVGARRHRPACDGRGDGASAPAPAQAARSLHDLVPPQGIRLTPRHYAYLKISEGCNHRCTFCIIPSMRGDLVSRPIGEVHDRGRKPGQRRRQGTAGNLAGHQRLRRRHQIPHRQFWNGRPIKTRMTELCAGAGLVGVWVRLHYVYPYPHVDDVIPLMAEGGLLPYLDVPFQHASPRILKR